MNLVIEIENNKDIPLIMSFLERIRGIKKISISEEDNEITNPEIINRIKNLHKDINNNSIKIKNIDNIWKDILSE